MRVHRGKCLVEVEARIVQVTIEECRAERAKADRVEPCVIRPLTCKATGSIQRAVKSRGAIGKRLLQKFAGIALFDEIADLGVGPGCYRREVHEGCDRVDGFCWSEGDSRGQAWS